MTADRTRARRTAAGRGLRPLRRPCATRHPIRFLYALNPLAKLAAPLPAMRAAGLRAGCRDSRRVPRSELRDPAVGVSFTRRLVALLVAHPDRGRRDRPRLRAVDRPVEGRPVRRDLAGRVVDALRRGARSGPRHRAAHRGDRRSRAHRGTLDDRAGCGARIGAAAPRALSHRLHRPRGVPVRAALRV